MATPETQPLSGYRELVPHSLVDARWIAVSQGYPFATILSSIEHVIGRELEITRRIRDNCLIEAIVASSQHIALLPRLTTPQNAGLTLIPLTGVTTSRRVVAIMRPDTAERGVVTRVREALRRSEQEPASPGAGTPPSR